MHREPILISNVGHEAANDSPSWKLRTVTQPAVV